MDAHRAWTRVLVVLFGEDVPTVLLDFSTFTFLNNVYLFSLYLRNETTMEIDIKKIQERPLS